MNQKPHVACNFNYLFVIGGLLKRTGSHKHCKCGNITEMMPNQVLVDIHHYNRKWYVTYRRIVTFCLLRLGSSLTYLLTYLLSKTGNSDDLERPSRSFTYSKLQMWFFVQLHAQQLTRLQLTASRAVPLRVAELLVKIWDPNHIISGMAETKQFEFCVQSITDECVPGRGYAFGVTWPL